MLTTVGSTAVAVAAISAALLSGTAPAAAAATAPDWGCPKSASASVTCINGGGSTSSANAYIGQPSTGFLGGELYQYAAANPGFGFSYEKAPGSAAQTALKDNLPSDFNGVLTETGYAVHFAASDSYVDSKSSLYPYVGANHPLPGSGGQFIQMPLFATASAIPINNAKNTANGKIVLTDSDLCGVFSGLLTNWNQTSASKKATAGTIKVYWRNDNAGASATFLLTQHLGAVCTTSNTKSGITFKTTTKFASLFPGVVTPPSDGTTAWTIPVGGDGSFSNFVGAKGSSGVADGVNNDATNCAIGYVSPDYTAIAAVSATTTSAKKYTSLFIASITNKNNSTSYTPTVTNITHAISNAASSPFSSPPSGSLALAQVQTNWVPQITTPDSGYPIVAFSSWLLPQCFASASVAAGIKGFLTNHLNGVYTTTLQNSGFVPLVGGVASGYGSAINQIFLTNAKKYNLDINNTTACKGVTGR